MTRKGSLRQRIMASVGAMVLLSLLSSTISLYRMMEVNRLLETINHVSVPLGRIFTQMQSDAEVFHRELERSLGQAHWKDPHWNPRPAPRWIEDILENEMFRVRELIQLDSEWTNPAAKAHWQEWSKQISEELANLSQEASRLYAALSKKDEVTASDIYPKWTTSIEEWKRQLQWGSAEFERSLRLNFATTESRVAELRTALEMILVIVVILSLLLLWLGEQALRPLGELTLLAREITRRGLRKEDKSLLPEVPISRSDEVSQLAREFHHMATGLLEREKTVESQKSRLQEQNKLLREIGELNQNILNSIESVLIVTDLNGRITQCNPEAIRWLGKPEHEIKGSTLVSWVKLQSLLEEIPNQGQGPDLLIQTTETWRLGPITLEDRVYGGYLMPLRHAQMLAHGAILVLDDLTDEVNLQVRLRRAENLAAVGRMSAQVAHEVRNPLHSIGLEAEMAGELAARLGNPTLKQSLQSILASVDRLQKITENYLKLSRLSNGQKSVMDLGEVLESVLATYAPVCEAQSVQVDWIREPRCNLKVWADRDLLEQVFGNLFRNSLQALENGAFHHKSSLDNSIDHSLAHSLPSPLQPRSDPNGDSAHNAAQSGQSAQSAKILWTLGNTESGRAWLRIQDNGPGIPPEIKDRLFIPFVTTRAQGTGLGLSFIKKVLEEHEGTIQNLALPSGQGACFELTLPLLEKQGARLQPEGVHAKDIVSG